MNKIFGPYIEPEKSSAEYLKIGFSPSSQPLQQRWRNNGLSADFLADYLSTFFPGEDPETVERRAEIKGSVSYVANELLENAMKYNYEPADEAITITLQMRLDEAAIRFYVGNCVDPDSLEQFYDNINQMLTEDPNELYMTRLMANEEDDQKGHSGLGFLTMLNDYKVDLGWQFMFRPENTNNVSVTTMVRLPI